MNRKELVKRRRQIELFDVFTRTYSSLRCGFSSWYAANVPVGEFSAFQPTIQQPANGCNDSLDRPDGVALSRMYVILDEE